MDPRFSLEQGTGIYTGNELIVKGALESQVGVITGYPGSPLAELFETLENNKDLFNEHGIVAQIANNEALAAARLNGSQMEGIRALAVMKSVGLHVAADGLALGNMVGAAPSGGVLVAVGDDTWSEGTQVPADSRFLSQHLYMPVLEPATFQEIKDWIGQGFELSRRSRLYLTYLVTSNQADGGGSVAVYPNRFAALNRQQRIALDPSTICSDERVIIPPATAHKEREVVHQRYPRLWQLAQEAGINQILYPPSDGPKPLGFITSGLAYSYLEHALHILGLTGHFPILKLGITYPVDPQMIAHFADCVQTFCVVEEKRPFIEPQIAAELARQKDLGPALWGKRFPGNAPGFPDVQGLHPSLIVQALSRLFAALDAELSIDREKLQAELDTLAPVSSTTAVPPRAPSFCPGCPHRDSASVLKKAAADLASPPDGQAPVDLVFHGDIGCYSMLKYAPFSELMHNLSGMGLGGGTGAGIDPFIDNKQLVFMGDSTFFHTGMIAISDSIKNGQDITYIILDNKTTAMTGHQPTPGVDVDVLGKPTFAQDIEKVVTGLAGDSSTFIARMDPAQREDYDALVRKTLLRDGVKIIIADKECGITYHRRERAHQSAIAKERGFLPVEQHINISEDVCEYCLECTHATGCSGLTVAAVTEYGPKIAIDPSACVADGACTRVEVGDGDKTCPSFEEITVQRKNPPTVSTPPIDVGQLPAPPAPSPRRHLVHLHSRGRRHGRQRGGLGAGASWGAAGLRSAADQQEGAGHPQRLGLLALELRAQGHPGLPADSLRQGRLAPRARRARSSAGPRTPRPLPHSPPRSHRRYRQHRQDPHDRHPHRPRRFLGRRPSRPHPRTHLFRHLLRCRSLPHLRALLGQQTLRQHYDARRGLPARLALPRARHLALGH